jgi:hypothetical protein
MAVVSRKEAARVFALIASILSISIVCSHQMLSGLAQQNSHDNPMPVDLGCETGAKVCEQEIEKIWSSQ